MKELQDYIFERGISNITKTEYERYVFAWLLAEGKIEGITIKNGISSIKPKEIVTIANKLQIPPTKVTNLLKSIYYSNILDDMPKVLPVTIICDHIKLDRSSFKKEKLELLINNPVEKEILKNFLAEKDAKYDTSFNKDLFIISFETMELLFDKKEKQLIVKKIEEVLSDDQKKIIDIDAETNTEKFAAFMKGLYDKTVEIGTAVVTQAATNVLLKS